MRITAVAYDLKMPSEGLGFFGWILFFWLDYVD
jgi:hypothetical protein